jgi:hypothetical protein
MTTNRPNVRRMFQESEPEKRFDIKVWMDNDEVWTKSNVTDEEAVELRSFVGEETGRIWTNNKETGVQTVYRARDMRKIQITELPAKVKTDE